MNTLLSVAGLLLMSGAPAAPEAAPPPEKIQASVQRSLTFLGKEGVQWMENRKCASCHHLPMTIWSLNEAKNQGYAVDNKALTEVTSFVLAADDRARLLPKPAKDAKAPFTLNQGALFMAVAMES